MRFNTPRIWLGGSLEYGEPKKVLQKLNWV